MSFTIPDTSAAFSPNQSRWTATDIAILLQGLKLEGVIYGAAVTAPVSPAMSVAVTAGIVKFASTNYVTVTARSVAIAAANSSRPRFDLVVVNTSGALSTLTGTPAANPEKPSIPANSIVLAEVYVPAGVSTILSSFLTDKRVIVDSSVPINPIGFGAVPDGATDSTTALQNAINAAEDSTPRRSVIIPGAFLITSPLKVRQSGLRIFGWSRAPHPLGAMITPANFIGPLIHVIHANELAQLTFHSALVGAGNSLAIGNSASVSWIDLMDSLLSLNGMSNICIEFFFSYSATGTLLMSQSVIPGGSSQQSAFQVWVEAATDHLRAALNVNGSQVVVTGSTPLSPDTVYHCALTYDGATVRLFHGRPGGTAVLDASTASSGLVVQDQLETITLGSGASRFWPKNGAFTAAATGSIDSIRISNTARYTSAYTVPNAKLSGDGNTELLHNFDNEGDVAFSVPAVAPKSTTYLPKYPPAVGNLIQNLTIDALCLDARNGIGLWLDFVADSIFHDLMINAGLYGILGYNSNFNLSLRNLRGVGNSTSRCLLVNAAGLLTIDQFDCAAYPVGISVAGGSGVISNSFFSGSQQRRPIILSSGGTWTLLNFGASNEDASAGNYLCNLLMDGVDTVTIIGSSLERYINGGPSIELHGRNGSLTLIGCKFTPNAAAAEVITIATAPTKKVGLINSINAQERTVPWSTTASSINVIA